MLDDATIDRCLAGVADTHDRLDAHTWRAVARTAGATFRLFVRRAGGWVRIELSPFLAAPEHPDKAARLHRELLARNRTLMEARFSLADDGDVILESVLDDQSPEDALAAALDAVVTAAEAHYTALRALL